MDGNWGVRDPIGMYASSVEVESHVVMGDPTSIDNLVEAFRRTKVKLNGLIMEPLASAEAVLSEDEREMGRSVGGHRRRHHPRVRFRRWQHLAQQGHPRGWLFRSQGDISIAFTTFFLAAEEAKIQFRPRLTRYGRP